MTIHSYEDGVGSDLRDSFTEMSMDLVLVTSNFRDLSEHDDAPRRGYFGECIKRRFR